MAAHTNATTNVGQAILEAQGKAVAQHQLDLVADSKAKALAELETATQALFNLPPEKITKSVIESAGYTAEIGWGWENTIKQAEFESRSKVKTVWLEPFRYWLILRPTNICFESLYQGFEANYPAYLPKIAKSLT